jgi:threonine synthase
MNYYSTRDTGQTNPASLEEAVLKGLAPDGGLYLPENIEHLGPEFIEALPELPLSQVAYEVAARLTGHTLPPDILKKIVSETIDFPLPVVHIENNIYSLELFHGPTMAFKDVGARFMARLMGWFVRDSKEPLKVIVATSGDTGSAVAAGFFDVKGIEVTIIYPKGKVSPLQEKQLTTWGGNIKAIELDGTFDDCQRIAKQLLADKELNSRHKLTSANSINIARLIPQSFYYFEAYARLKHLGKPIVICVPSGNFGNLTGGLLAKKMGLPIDHFVAATNANDIVPHYLNTGNYTPRNSVQTVSNAMDVGHPSNFERLNALFGESLNEFRAHLSGYSCGDDQTLNAMRDVYLRTGYELDPHGAVAYLGLKAALALPVHKDKTGVILETAHPAKFLEIGERALSRKITVPKKLQAFAEKQKMSIQCGNDYKTVRDIIEK